MKNNKTRFSKETKKGNITIAKRRVNVEKARKIGKNGKKFLQKFPENYRQFPKNVI